MSIEGAIRQGPPKWFIRLVVILAVFVIGLQFGMYRQRSKETARTMKEELAWRDRAIDGLKIALSYSQYDASVEREKLQILTCESGLQHQGIWGDGGKSYGIAQFQYATFKDLRDQAGRPALRWKSRDDQLWLLDWALRHGYGKYWSCYKGGNS